MLTCCNTEEHYSTTGACFSEDRARRFLLWRNWNTARPAMAALLLNPSIADETVLDPTLTRVSKYAKAWGFGGIRILNAFAIVSTNPRGLRGIDLDDPVNDDHIRMVLHDPHVGRVMVGWGSNIARQHLMHRREQLQRMLREAYAPVYAWRLTKAGDPTHPLYLPAEIDPVRYDVEIAA